jgi:hypothetical protein
MKKRGQISVEYIMIIAFSLMIILPGIYFLRGYIFESNDNLLHLRLDEISNTILGRATKMHFYGPPSKSIVEIDIPSSIELMYIVSVPSNNEYYLAYTVLSSSGRIEKYFLADQPIKNGETVPCPTELDCLATCECFPKRYNSKGIKNIRVKSVQDPTSNLFYIEIKEISSELI